MFESKVYNDGMLIVGKMSGVVEPQSFINGIFWQIDSRNVGEVKEGFSQLYYDGDVSAVVVTEDDIKKIAKFNTGIGANVGRFRTALVLRHPEIIRLAKLHKSLARNHGYEVRIFDNLEDGFAWLVCDNPEPEIISL
jgi:beta-galactosidase GanA